MTASYTHLCLDCDIPNHPRRGSSSFNKWPDALHPLIITIINATIHQNIS